MWVVDTSQFPARPGLLYPIITAKSPPATLPGQLRGSASLAVKARWLIPGLEGKGREVGAN